MAIPRPQPGAVIPYDYLWSHERERGLEEGRKTRPVLIVLAVARRKDGREIVSVATITHSIPIDPKSGIEIPPRVKTALKMDRERSWIMCNEINQFVWPGYDIRQVPRSRNEYSYGFVPPLLLDAVVERILELNAAEKLKRVSRD